MARKPLARFSPATNGDGINTPSADSWKGAVSGNWSDAALWSLGVAPTATTSALIETPGTYTITVANAAQAASLTLDDASATLNVTASLSVTGTIAVQAGTLSLAQGATLVGGTLLASAGGVLALDNGGTLVGTDLQGTLTLAKSGGNLNLGAGLAANSHATIVVTGASEILGFSDSATLQGTAIDFRSVSGNYVDQIYLDDSSSSAATFTIGATSSIEADHRTLLTSSSFSPNIAQITIVNDGTISVVGPLGELDAGAQMAAFDNAGLIQVSGGGTLRLNANVCNNTGTITVGGTGSAVYYGDAQSSSPIGWTNAGTIEVGQGGTLYLENTGTVAELNAISNNGGTIAIENDINGPGTITLVPSANALQLDGGISGATILGDGGQLILTGPAPALVNDLFEGTLTIDSGDNYASLFVENVAFAGIGDTGQATINMLGDDPNFSVAGTIDNAVLNLEGNFSYGEFGDPPITVTFGSNFVLSVGSQGANITDWGGDTLVNQGKMLLAGRSYFSQSAGSSIVNSGTIIVNAGADVSGIGGNADNGFANSGVLLVSAAGTIGLSETTLSNTGEISVNGSHSVLSWGTYIAGSSAPGSVWSNQGSMSVSNGATLEIGGGYDLATLQSISNEAGNLDAFGLIISTGGTFNVAAALAQGGHLNLSANVVGGTIIDTEGALAISGGLSGVTFDGTLSLKGADDVLAISKGLSLHGAAGTGAATIDVSGAGAGLDVLDSETLTNAHVAFGSAGNSASILVADGSTLTLGSALSLVQGGVSTSLSVDTSQGFAPTFLVNQGSITASIAGGSFTIDDEFTRFTSSGTILIADGDHFSYGGSFTQSGTVRATGAMTIADFGGATSVTGSVSAASGAEIAFAALSNLSSGTLTGGTYTVQAGSSIALSSGVLTTDKAVLTLQGRAATIMSQAGGTSSGIDATLATVASGGSLALINRTDKFTANGGTFTDNGGLSLSAASLTATGLMIGDTGTLSGTGAIKGAVTNFGTISAAGGTLTFLSGVENSGVTQVENGTILFTKAFAGGGSVDLGRAGAATFDTGIGFGARIMFTGQDGTLNVALPASFHGLIGGFGATDAIDLLNVSATSESYAKGVLTLTSGTSAVADLRFSGAYTSSDFTLTPDGHGGTLLRFG